ncbi:MAG: hypothetical protein CHACPFDD_03849 [Phycisphaerae bacterium]|nr:hypothetical protein [Phycisphaerae bacterium]
MSYVYYKTGHASNVTIKDAGDEVYRGLALYYTRTGRLWLAIWEQWELDEYQEVTNYAATAAREFMYDSGRARYLARDLDPATFEPDGAQRWTDYAGGPFDAAAGPADEPYGDFAVTIGQQGAAVIDESMRYLNGGDGAGGVLSQQAVVEGEGDAIDYLHGDLIRSTVATTDADGQNGAYAGPPVTVAYTAFGEIVTRDGSGNVTIGSAAPSGFPRYQYAGGFGYESGSADASDAGGLLTLNGAEGTSPIRLMHVGERWYEPDVGRFVMRDPIGIVGGPNAYAYAGGSPLTVVDPQGLLPGFIPPWCYGPLPARRAGEPARTGGVTLGGTPPLWLKGDYRYGLGGRDPTVREMIEREYQRCLAAEKQYGVDLGCYAQYRKRLREYDLGRLERFDMPGQPEYYVPPRPAP